MAEAKKKQADTNKDKDADIEAVHDGTGIVRYAHHMHSYTQTYIHTYIHTYIYIYIYMHEYM